MIKCPMKNLNGMKWVFENVVVVTGVEDEQVLKGETDDHLSRFYGFGCSKQRGRVT